MHELTTSIFNDFRAKHVLTLFVSDRCNKDHEICTWPTRPKRHHREFSRVVTRIFASKL